MRNEVRDPHAPSDRVFAREDADGLTIDMAPPDQIGVKIFLVIWCTAWFGFGMLAIVTLLMGGTLRSRGGNELTPEMTALFMGLWLVCMVYGVPMLTWRHYGRERVEMKGTVLRRSVLTPVRDFIREFDIGQIRGFRIVEKNESTFRSKRLALPLINRGKVEFDYGHARASFGAELRRPEAIYVAERLNRTLQAMRGGA